VSYGVASTEKKYDHQDTFYVCVFYFHSDFSQPGLSQGIEVHVFPPPNIRRDSGKWLFAFFKPG